MARGRPSRPPKAPVVATEAAAPQVFVARPIYRCPHCGSSKVLRDGGSVETSAAFECQRCGTCPTCERPGALQVGGAFQCRHCATRDGRLSVFPIELSAPRANGAKTNRTKFKLPVWRTVAPPG